jgi:hypothetical protein
MIVQIRKATCAKAQAAATVSTQIKKISGPRTTSEGDAGKRRATECRQRQAL